MPFEELRRRNAAQEAAEKEAEQRHKRARIQYETEEYAKRKAEEARRRASAESAKRYFEESRIDSLTDELIKIFANVGPKIRDERISKTIIPESSICGIEVYEEIHLSWKLWRKAGEPSGTYYTISTGFQSDGTLVVEGSSLKRIPRSEWQRDKRIIEKALEDAYRHPIITDTGSTPQSIDRW